MRLRNNFPRSVLCALLSCGFGLGAQTPPGAVLKIDLKDFVPFQVDVSDYAKLATDPGIVMTATGPHAFGSFSTIADVVAVNGRPAKGTFVDRAGWVRLNPNAQAGQAIADTTRSVLAEWHCEILQEDGTPVGSIAGVGLNGGTAPPGAPSGSAGGTFVVTGGTGAFLGMRGQGAFGSGSTVDVRRSAVEDPVNRRLHGGAAMPLILYLIPLSQPEIVATAAGPAVVHASDNSLVTAAKPAKSGEILTLYATGLGPTRPGLEPGAVFTSNPIQVVNSPIDVTVASQSAEVLFAGGFPGSTNGYQVNFRLPSSVSAGTSSLIVSAAWIAGPDVKIAIQ